MNRVSSPSTGFRLFTLLASLLVCIAVLVLIVLARSRTPPFLVLHASFSRPLPVRDRLLQWIPAASSWKWVPRVEDLFFGRRKPINLYSDIVAIPASVADALSSRRPSSLGSPDFSTTNGLRVWLLRDPQLKSLRDFLRGTVGADFLSHPRISTADGVEASIFVGESVLLDGSTNSVGLSAAFFPRARNACTDLFAMISFTELVTNQNGLQAASALSIRTNLDIAARLQVPTGSGLFLLGAKSESAGQTRFGALIEPPSR